LLAGVSVTIATTITVTVFVAVTVQPTFAPSAYIFVPSLGCAMQAMPTVAPVIVAVPDALAPAARREPPMEPVVPERIVLGPLEVPYWPSRRTRAKKSFLVMLVNRAEPYN
jgi:hypothetical protein